MTEITSEPRICQHLAPDQLQRPCPCLSPGEREAWVKEFNKELSTTSYADKIWNVDIHMPKNQSCYLPDNIGKDSCKVYAFLPLSAIT